MQRESLRAERLEQKDTLNELLESWENEIEMSGTSAIMMDYSMINGDLKETNISNETSFLFSDETEPKPSTSTNEWENDRLFTEDLTDECVTNLPKYKHGSLDDIFGIDTSISSDNESIRDVDQFYNLMWPRNNKSTLPTVNNARIQRDFKKKLTNYEPIIEEKGIRIKTLSSKGIRKTVNTTRIPKYLKQYYIYLTILKKEVAVYLCRICNKSYVELEKGMLHNCNRRKAGRRTKNSQIDH